MKKIILSAALILMLSGCGSTNRIPDSINTFIGDDYTEIEVLSSDSSSISTGVSSIKGNDAAKLKAWFGSGEYESCSENQYDSIQNESYECYSFKGSGGKEDMGITLYIMDNNAKYVCINKEWYKMKNNSDFPL